MYQSNETSSQISAINRKKELQELLCEFREGIENINIDDSVLPPKPENKVRFRTQKAKPTRQKMYKSLSEEINDLINEVSFIEKKVKALGFTRYSNEMTKVQQVKDYLISLKSRADSLQL